MIKAYNLYIHTPFCISKCKYCAFFSKAVINPDWDSFTNNILNELDYWKNKLGKLTISTIFFGGGTPSLIPCQYFEKIINNIQTNFILEPNTEITIEANPKTIDEQKLINLRQMGINRISIGIQSLDDEKLRFLGRTHTTKDALVLLETANKLNFRTSGDFIYGLPDENIETIQQICTDINKLGLKHCSMYELTIEPNTPFGKMNLQLPNNIEMAKMYTIIPKFLKLNRYEISNYSIIGEECKHNQNVWDGQPYLGIGRGAAGRVFYKNAWYEQMGNNELFSPLSNKQRAIEQIITGLRTAKGVRLTDDIKSVIDVNFIESCDDLLYDNDRLKTTDKGALVLDTLIQKVIK